MILTVSGIAASPALANGGSTTVPCKVAGVDSGSFTVDNNVVTTNTSCAGVATIPSGVTSIAADAFLRASGLTSVSIPNTVVTIGDSAFRRASALTSITIPANVTSIGGSAFLYATSLNNVTFAPGSRLEVIGDNAFYEASALSEIEIPAGVTEIDESTFSGATSLVTVEFAPNSKLETISDYAFWGTTALTSIAIPASVTTIGSYAFNNANSLASVTFTPNSELEVIDDGAFKFASSLTTITIPASVTRINDDAFANSGLLNSVYFLGNAPLVDDDAFDGTGSYLTRTAYIKSGAEGFTLSEGDDRWNGLKVAVGVYTATFNSNGGSSVAAADVIRNGSISAPTPPTRSGYKFAGWSATNGGSVLTFPYTPPANADLTLYAKWTSNSTTPATNNAKKSIKFSTSSLVLTKANKAALKKLVKSSGKDASYVVTGTAGRLPGVTEAHVKNLAKLRANVVKTYLVKLGVKKSNIKVKAKVVNQGIVPKTKILTRYLDS